MFTFNWAGVNALWQRATEPVLRWLSGYLDVLLTQLARVREFWFWYVIGPLLFPLAIIVFMTNVGATLDPNFALHAVTGNAVLSLIFGPVSLVSGRLAWARELGELEYYAALPISRAQMVLAITTMSVLFSLPALIMVLLVGSLLVGLPLSFHPLLILTVPVVALSLAGLGAIIGIWARTGQQGNQMANLVMVVAMFLSPVLVPMTEMPQVMQWTARLIPSTYAAGAFRAVTSRQISAEFWLDVAVLAAFAVGLIYIATQRLDWRRD